MLRIASKILIPVILFSSVVGSIMVFKSSASSSTQANLWVDPSGGTCARQSSPGTYVDNQACTFDQAYQNAVPGDLVLIKGGTYSGLAEVNGTTSIRINNNLEKSTALDYVTFEPEGGSDVNITADRFVIYGSRLKIKGGAKPYNLHLKNLIINASQANNQNNSVYENLDGKAFFIGPVSNVQIIGGNYGPNQATCNDTYGVVFEPHIASVNGWETGSQPTGIRPTNITLDGLSIHGQTSDDLSCQHTGGMIIEDGNGVTIRNTKFYNNNVYDIEAGDTGNTPDNVTLENNWFSPGTDQLGNDAGQREVQFAQNGAFDNWLVRYNSFKNGLDISQNRPSSTHTNMRVIGNIGGSSDCGVFGVTYAYNAWVANKCAGSDIQISTFPYINLSLATPDYHLNDSPSSIAVQGVISSGAPDYAIGTDFDNEVRTNPLDIGSDEKAGSAQSCSSKAGDINNDSHVDIFDLSILLSKYGQSSMTCSDITGDGNVDMFDMSILLRNYGN